MRSRMSSSRGPQRVLVTVAILMTLAGLVQYWRLRTVNADLTDQLVRLEGLLQAAEEKSSKIDSQRKEAGEDLKKANANFQQLQITKDEEATKCRHIQDTMEELIDKKELLQKELEDDKENHDAELRDMAGKLKSLQSELAKSRLQSKTALATAQQELETVQRQLSAAQQEAADAASCRSQLTQAQAELVKCQSAATGQQAPAAAQSVGQSGPAIAATAPGGSGGAWPGLKAPQHQLSQQLFESAGPAGGLQQGQVHVVPAAAQQRVLPVPPGAAAAAAAASSSTSTSAKPAVGQDLDPLAKPQSREEAAEGAGVLAPPQQPEEQHEEPAKAAKEKEEGDEEEEEPQLGLDDAEVNGDGDGGLHYPVDGDKDALNDHPDTDVEADAEAKDAALIKGLQELSNKSGQHEELPGPEPQQAIGEGGMSAPEMVAAEGVPELAGGDQAGLPLR